MFFLNNMYGFILYTSLKLTCGIRARLLALGGCLCCWGFDAVDRSWVCDKPGFNGSFAVLICPLKENGEHFKNRDQEI